MYEADACILQASAFSVVEKYRCKCDMITKRIETTLKMKTERFTAVKRSVFV